MAARPPLALALALLLLVACYARKEVEKPEPPPSERPTTYSEEKRRLVEEMERRMNALLTRHQDELLAIQNQLGRDLAALEPPVTLNAVERSLSSYGAAETERYEAKIDRLVADAVEATEARVGREPRAGKPRRIGEAEREAWAIAAEIGGRGQGAGYGLVSGVLEVDERADVTIELLQGFADVQGLRAVGALRKGERVDCSETFRHDLTVADLEAVAPALAQRARAEGAGDDTRVARMRLYQSDELEDFRYPQQESRGVVVAFESDRLAADANVELVQAVRTKVTRGGMVVEDWGWRLDPTLPGGEGRLPLVRDFVDERYLASAPFFPAVNDDHSRFEHLKDFTVIFDYKSMAVAGPEPTVLGAIDWQLVWNVSETGQVRFIDPIPAGFDAEAGPLLAQLRAGAGAQPLAAREPSPNDAMRKRVTAGDRKEDMPLRDVGGGRMARIGDPVAKDHLRVSSDGWRYLVARRIRLIAEDARFMSYFDGEVRRWVLSLADIADDSPLLDLGFRDGDAILSVNERRISSFSELFATFAENGPEKRYEVGVLRDGAYRTFVYDVDLPEGEQELPPEELSESTIDRLNRMLAESVPSPEEP